MLMPSLETVERTLAADIAYTISRMKVLERLPGNPIGMDARWIDDTAVALRARIPAFSRVVGLRRGHESQLESLMHWYRDAGMRPTFEIVPGHFVPSLGHELHRLGFVHSGFHASLIAAIADLPLSAAAETIVRVTTPEAMERYLDAYVAGWGIAEGDADAFKANVRPWMKQPGWSLYFAEIDGHPAAAATLYMHEGAAYLADAATAPRFRGRGLQQSLLRRRIADAADLGAQIVFSGAAPFSTSHRNMERVGMRVQFMRALWTLRE